MVHVISISRKGSKSAVNEDACLALASKGVFVVADGVGGGPSGDFASRTAVEAIEASCRDSSEPDKDLLQAIQIANRKIYQAAQDPRLTGMATTIAAVVVQADSFLVCHVGDSRVYQLGRDDGKLHALTRDHSKVIEKPNQVRKLVVSNALGVRETVKVELNRFALEDQSLILLMTDGISDVLDEPTIEGVLKRPEMSMSEKLNKMVTDCEQLGGQDDKTIICVF